MDAALTGEKLAGCTSPAPLSSAWDEDSGVVGTFLGAISPLSTACCQFLYGTGIEYPGYFTISVWPTQDITSPCPYLGEQSGCPGSSHSGCFRSLLRLTARIRAA